jgi:hypothetical protein
MKRVDDLVIRPAIEDDRQSFRDFTCSSGAAYEDAVEAYVQTKLLDRALERPDSVRLLSAWDGERLVACGSHTLEILGTNDSFDFRAPGDTQMRVRAEFMARLNVMAVTRELHGHRFDSGEKLSHHFMEALCFDALLIRQQELISGVVHRDNLRSLEMCRRAGLNLQTRHGPEFVRVTGYFKARTY